MSYRIVLYRSGWLVDRCNSYDSHDSHGFLHSLPEHEGDRTKALTTSCSLAAKNVA
jgi:hypothetical protein